MIVVRKYFFQQDRMVLRSLPTLHFHSPKGIKEVLVAQLCPTLCNPMDWSPPGFSVHGFSRQEYWSGLPFPSPGDLPDPGIKPRSPALQADFYHLSHQGSPKGGNKHRYNLLRICLKCFLPI